MKKIKQFFLILFVLILQHSCYYDKNPVIENGGFFEGMVESYTGASRVITVNDVKIYPLPEIQSYASTISNDKGKFYLDNIPEGNYILRLEKEDYYTAFFPAKVYSGQTTRESMMIQVIDTNNIMPLLPDKPFPRQDGYLYDTAFVLSWRCSDPNEDPLYYDIYFSEHNPPMECINRETRESTYKIDSLISGKTYYWRIKVRDYFGAELMGDIWKFEIREL